MLPTISKPKFAFIYWPLLALLRRADFPSYFASWKMLTTTLFSRETNIEKKVQTHAGLADAHCNTVLLKGFCCCPYEVPTLWVYIVYENWRKHATTTM